MFYDVYLALCQRIGKKPTVVAAELGINKSNVSNWKNNGYTPRGEALQRMADYFHVTTDYLLGQKQTPYSSPAIIMGFGGERQIMIPDKKKSDKYCALLELLDGLSDDQIGILIQVAQSMK